MEKHTVKVEADYNAEEMLAGGTDGPTKSCKADLPSLSENKNLKCEGETFFFKDGIVMEDFVKEESDYFGDHFIEDFSSTEKEARSSEREKKELVKTSCSVEEDSISPAGSINISTPAFYGKIIHTNGKRKPVANIAETLQYASDVEDFDDDDVLELDEDDHVVVENFFPDIDDYISGAECTEEHDSDGTKEALEERRNRLDTVILEIGEEALTSCGMKRESRTQRKQKTRVFWEHITGEKACNIPPIPSFEVNEFPEETVLLPIEYFQKFITDDILDLIVEQSNLYSSQKNIANPLALDRLELEQWLGLCLYFSISRISDTRLHWGVDTVQERVASVMSRDRWEEIRTSFHSVDNSNIDPNDKIFKVRPLVDHLRSKFREIPMLENLCVDEQIVPFKGASSLKQYTPKKPHKWGYKFFILSDNKGIVYDFMPYVGKIQPVSNPNVPDLGPSSNSVLQLAECIPSFRNHKLYFDNWFTSLPLIKHLACRGIWCTGTVQPKRLHSLAFKTDKQLEARGRGAYDEWQTNCDGTNIRAVQWLDTRSVCLVSTLTAAHPVDSCMRYDKKTKTRIQVPLPNIVKTYNKNMGGVDLHDRLISLYRMSFRSKKYYQRIIFHLIDMVVVNSWLLYRRSAEYLDIPRRKQTSLCQFKLRIANSLMLCGKSSYKERGRPSEVQHSFVKKKKTGRATYPIPDKDIRVDGVGHFPAIGETRFYGALLIFYLSKAKTYTILYWRFRTMVRRIGRKRPVKIISTQ